MRDVDDGQHAAPVAFILDGHELTARAGESILDAALRHGFDIPHLCHQQGLRPAGNFRASASASRKSTTAASRPVSGRRLGS